MKKNMHRKLISFMILLTTIFLSCNGGEVENYITNQKKVEYTKFKGSYKAFKDQNDVHISAAINQGIEPMCSYTDTVRYKDQLVHLPQELDIYKTDKLTHSIPYLVPKAAKLLVEIGLNFRDSLFKKKIPPYKLVITSVTRSIDDNVRLSKRNFNVSQNSAHCYGTTFDISWRRFASKDMQNDDQVSRDHLKLVLAEVLYDLRERKKCYVMYETKQACFHITVR